MMYALPKSLVVCGTEYEIRSDYRAALDICAALSDSELSDQDKAFVILNIFYPNFAEMPQEHYQEAIERCFWFINCGDEQQSRPAPKLMDWEQDFRYIVAPINRVMGQEIRALEYDYENNTGGLHWWSFISAYYEIGDCLFAQIVRIRDKKARGRPLDKEERKFYQENRQMVDFHTNYTDAENALLKQWGGG